MKKLIILCILLWCGSVWAFPPSPPPTGTSTTLDVSNFDNNLSSADDTVQEALETLDETAGGTGAPTTAHYLTDQAEAGLSAEVVVTANGVSLITAANYAAMKGLLNLEIGTDVLAPAGDGSSLTGLVLSQFDTQTAWRVFYSNTDGDVTELALGADGTYLRSNGATSAPTFGTPAGSVTVTDDESTNDDQEIVFTTDNSALESDGDFTYNPSTGTLNVTILTGIGTAITALNGENIQDDTIDDDSIDFADVTLLDFGLAETHDTAAELDALYQAADADLTTYGGITPSANVQSILGVADYATLWAIAGFLSAGLAELDDENWTFTGDIDVSGASSFTTGPLTFADANGDPTALQLRYDNTVTGLTNGAMVWHDDDTGIRYLVDLRAAPSDDDYVVAYDAAVDNFYMKEDAGAAGGDSVEIDSVAVVDPDFVSTGDIDFVDTSNTITANLNADVIAAAEMADADHGDVAWSSGVATVQAVSGANAVDSDAYVDGSIDAVHLATGAVYTATATKSAAYTIGTDDAKESYGGVIYVTSAATITAPAVTAGMSFSVITIGATAVSVDVNASDRMYLDGTALDDGDKATNTSTTGDIISCTYESAAGWYCAGGSPDGDAWTDGGP